MKKLSEILAGTILVVHLMSFSGWAGPFGQDITMNDTGCPVIREDCSRNDEDGLCVHYGYGEAMFMEGVSPGAPLPEALTGFGGGWHGAAAYDMGLLNGHYDLCGCLPSGLTAGCGSDCLAPKKRGTDSASESVTMLLVGAALIGAGLMGIVGFRNTNG
jgi:hypothetical protein